MIASPEGDWEKRLRWEGVRTKTYAAVPRSHDASIDFRRSPEGSDGCRLRRFRRRFGPLSQVARESTWWHRKWLHVNPRIERRSSEASVMRWR
jgi:hypothetical protein